MNMSLSSGIAVWPFEIDLERPVVAPLAAAADQAGAFSLWCDREVGRTRQRIILKTELIWPRSCHPSGSPNQRKRVSKLPYRRRFWLAAN